ncbi:MAG TPA: response regulator [Polyangia bacterium]
MLPNEETTRSDVSAKPGEVEALVAVAGREEARPLVAFLREHQVNVTLVPDGESAFEEAVLHRPNVVLIHENLPPGSGFDLCQRLKANTRTHFLPAILFAGMNSAAVRARAFAAGADAVFAPGDDAQERRARLWSLLRTQALFRRQERKRETQGAALRERGQWLGSFMHDLQNVIGALQANFEFLAKTIPQPGSAPVYLEPTDVLECTDETQALLRQVARGLRTVQEYERFESGRVVVKPEMFGPFELLHEVCADVRSVLRIPSSGRLSLTVDEGSGATLPPVRGDRDLLRRALASLVLLLHRQPGGTSVKLGATPTDDGVMLALTSDAAPVPVAEAALLFDPFATTPRRGPLAERFELALAKAIIEMNAGELTSHLGAAAAGFLVELRSKNGWPKSH